jgi:Arc/MetJ-type ribon-helix-helix transcriptional regulator
MLINIKLEGFSEDILNQMVNLGIASNRTEAIRMALLYYNEQHHIKKIEQYIEDQLAVRKMQQLDEEIDEGKRKILTAKEALGEKYAKMLE